MQNKKKTRKFPIDKCQLKISTTFPVRTRCKKCSSLPCFYFNYPKSHIQKDPKKLQYYFGRDNKFIIINNDDYTDFSQQNLKLKNIRYSLHMNFNTQKHQKNKKIGTDYSKNKIECLTCECGKTLWDFYDLAGSEKPEIFNKRAPYAHPQVFEF